MTMGRCESVYSIYHFCYCFFYNSSFLKLLLDTQLHTISFIIESLHVCVHTAEIQPTHTAPY